MRISITVSFAAFGCTVFTGLTGITRAPDAMSFLTSTSTLRVFTPRRSPLRHLHCLRLASTPLRTTRTLTQRRAMATRDVSVQSDIAKSFANRAKDSDGSFNRRPSTFRDTIAKGSKYEPERGTSGPSPLPVSVPSQSKPPSRRY